MGSLQRLRRLRLLLSLNAAPGSKALVLGRGLSPVSWADGLAYVYGREAKAETDPAKVRGGDIGQAISDAAQDPNRRDPAAKICRRLRTVVVVGWETSEIECLCKPWTPSSKALASVVATQSRTAIMIWDEDLVRLWGTDNLASRAAAKSGGLIGAQAETC